MKKWMFLVIVAGCCNLSWAADECSVGEFHDKRSNFSPDSPVEVCRGRLTNKECATTRSMQYSDDTIALSTTLGGCGLKSSEIKLENGKLSGEIYLCNKNRQVKSMPFRTADCQERKSQDGKYSLYVCYPGSGVFLYTLAFPVSEKERRSGYFLIQEVGAIDASAVNELNCGPDRVKPKMAPKPGQQDVRVEDAQATS